MKNFVEFIRAQGVIGLAISFILGGTIQKVVTALVNDIINPVLGIILNIGGGLKEAVLVVGSVRILWDDFVSVYIDFIVISAVIYILVHGLRLDKLDKKKA